MLPDRSVSIKLKKNIFLIFLCFLLMHYGNVTASKIPNLVLRQLPSRKLVAAMPHLIPLLKYGLTSLQ